MTDVDIKAIQKIAGVATVELDNRPTVAKTMRSCGCTYEQIGQALGVTRQLAKYYADKEK